MVRSTSATTFTYSGTKNFEDGAEAYAQWATDRISVCIGMCDRINAFTYESAKRSLTPNPWSLISSQKASVNITMG
jgi:hypothetical protein